MAWGVVATTTFYTSVQDLRFQLALAMVREATKSGYPVVIVDGSPEPEVARILRMAGANVFREEANSNMGRGRRQVLREAGAYAQKHAIKSIVWMEPEKEPLVPFLEALCQDVYYNNADIVIPHRSEAGFDSYPVLQIHAEKCGNEAWRRVSGISLDVWFGPRVMNHAGLDYFLLYNGHYGDKWDSIFIPVLRACAEGAKVKSVEVEYRHPPLQTQQEAADTAVGISKRIDQLKTLVTALCSESTELGLPKVKT